MNRHLLIHTLTPDAARAARVRQKCRRTLESRKRRANLVAPVIVGAFSIFYVDRKSVV